VWLVFRGPYFVLIGWYDFGWGFCASVRGRMNTKWLLNNIKRRYVLACTRLVEIYLINSHRRLHASGKDGSTNHIVRILRIVGAARLAACVTTCVWLRDVSYSPIDLYRRWFLTLPWARWPSIMYTGWVRKSKLLYCDRYFKFLKCMDQC